MKTTITHAWQPEDASLAYAENAFNRLRSFLCYDPTTDKGEDREALKAYRRAVEDGSMFTAADITAAAALLGALALRADERYSGRSDDQAAAVQQAAENAYGAAAELQSQFFAAWKTDAAS